LPYPEYFAEKERQNNCQSINGKMPYAWIIYDKTKIMRVGYEDIITNMIEIRL